MPRKKPSGVSILLLVVIALGMTAVRFAFIEGSLPYVRHGDEMMWASRSLGILQSGDLNPHRFTKGGAHVYFMTAGLALGFVRAAANVEVDKLQKMGSEVCFEYKVPRAAGVAKKMYALVSVLAVVLAGVLAFRLTGQSAALWLAPLFVCVSENYLYYSWWYMNTNVLGAFGIIATVAYPFLAREGVSTQRKALVLGTLSGFTIATKYNFFLILLPACAYFILHYRERALSHCLLVVGAAIVTFVALTPYAILDIHTFVAHVGREAFHYANGHFDGSTQTFEPGWEMFQQYFAVLHDSFGSLVLVLSVVGLGWLLLRDARSAVVVFLFPVVFFAYMTDQRTFFERNLMSLHLFVGIGAAMGFLYVVGLLAGWLGSRPWFGARPLRARIGGALLGALFVLAALPWDHVRAAYDPEEEPRHQAVEWILDNVPPGSLLLVEKRVLLSTGRLEEEGYEVVPIKLESGRDSQERLRATYGNAVVVHPRFLSDPHEEILLGATSLAEFGHRPVDVSVGLGCGRFPPKVKIGRLG